MAFVPLLRANATKECAWPIITDTWKLDKRQMKEQGQTGCRALK